jgi:hypothetical protein
MSVELSRPSDGHGLIYREKYYADQAGREGGGAVLYDDGVDAVRFGHGRSPRRVRYGTI